MYFSSNEKEECCGCTACLSSCPVHAISMEKDYEGFLYPHINKEKCINCKLCEKVCPMANPNYENENNPLAYAAMLKDVNQRQRSSSGGIFYAIATWVISCGGIVYGAAMSEKLKVIHVGVDNFKDLEKLRGSKYVQSYLGNTYSQIKKQLQLGRLVYFVGTGCQVAGLKSYLRKPYNNLLTSDLICHGVPSQILFDKHLAYLEKKHSGKIITYQFRNNKIGGGCEIFDFVHQNGKIKTITNPSYELSPYLYSFMYAYTYRYSCYSCPFAKVPRQGDITLADFWGVKEFFPEIDSSKGISLVLINNKYGQGVWTHIKDAIEWYQSKVEDGAKYNRNLSCASNKPEIRNFIYQIIEKDGYEKIAKSIFKSPREKSIRVFYYLNQKWWYHLILKIVKPIKTFCFKC